MSNFIDKIIALKAFYLGSDIRELTSKIEISEIIDKINKKIDNLSKENNKYKVDKLLYLLIKCDILRNDNNQDEIIFLRKKSKDIADELESNIFIEYMKIIEATQTKNRVYGLSEGHIKNTGITKRHPTDPECLRFHDNAMVAVGLSETELNYELKNFLLKVKLSEIIENEEILYKIKNYGSVPQYP